MSNEGLPPILLFPILVMNRVIFSPDSYLILSVVTSIGLSWSIKKVALSKKVNT